jgi:Pyridoxamine 5'-phosphate oxidase
VGTFRRRVGAIASLRRGTTGRMRPSNRKRAAARTLAPDATCVTATRDLCYGSMEKSGSASARKTRCKMSDYAGPVTISEMTEKECREFLVHSSFGRLACARENEPYIVPIYFAYEPDHLYGFSTFGQKIEWAARSAPQVRSCRTPRTPI